MQDAHLRELHNWLLARGPVTKADIVRAMKKERGWARTTTEHRLTRLVAAALASAPSPAKRVFRARAYRDSAPEASKPIHHG